VNEALVLCAAAVLLVALANWRAALLLALCAGFGQDVVRKLTPGEPLYMVLLFAPLFAAAALGLLLRGGTLRPGPMFRLHPVLRAPVLVFLAVVAMQVLVTLAGTGSMVLAGIGTMVYVLPFLALVVAMYFARDLDAIVIALRCHVLLSVVFSAGVYLDVAGYPHGILDSVGVGLFIYPPEGGVLELPSGLFRSPETAAWHGATAAALASVLILVRRFPGGALPGLLVILFLAGAVVLTGRRKMVVELVVFASVFAALLAFYRGRGLRLVALLGGLSALLAVGQMLFVPDHAAVQVRPYVSRYDTVAQEATARLRASTVGSLRWVVQRNGWLGSGAGTASQGASHFGGGAPLVGYAAEGGLAKLLAELGVHGLLAAAWVAAALALAGHASLRRLHAAGAWRHGIACTGLAALLIANVLVFATASQVFGDPFVLTLLGLLLGFVLRAPVPHAEPVPPAQRVAHGA